MAVSEYLTGIDASDMGRILQHQSRLPVLVHDLGAEFLRPG